MLSTQAVVSYCVLIVCVALFFRVLPKLVPGVLGYASDISVNKLLSASNEERRKAGVEPLRLNKNLTLAAQKKAEHMFTHNYWAHVAPDGTEPWTFILDTSYDYVFAGENLAKNFNDSQDVVTAWYNSPSHRDNLLSPNYDEMGFAVMNGTLDGYETTLVVQFFGRPRNKSLLATADEEQEILSGSLGQVLTFDQKAKTVAASVAVPAKTTTKPIISAVLPKTHFFVDIVSSTQVIAVGLGSFILGLLVLDFWYSKKHSIAKASGHTFAHVLLISITLLGIWLVLSPGAVI